jgi:hypothetical protein
MSVQIALAALFGLILGSGATFAYLVLQDVWASKSHEKTNQEIAAAITAAVDAGALVKVTSKKRKKYKDTVSPDEAE